MVGVRANARLVEASPYANTAKFAVFATHVAGLQCVCITSVAFAARVAEALAFVNTAGSGTAVSPVEVRASVHTGIIGINAPAAR